MQKGSYHKFKLTMLNGSAWGLAVQDHQVSGEDYSAPKPEKNCILSRMFGRNTSNHCSKVFHEHEVGSLRKWTTCIPFSFSVQYQPTAHGAIHCKDVDLGVGEEADCPTANHILTCKTAQLCWLLGSYTHRHQLKICLFSYKKNNFSYKKNNWTYVTWSCIKIIANSHSRHFLITRRIWLPHDLFNIRR